jgi:hypothetical protein
VVKQRLRFLRWGLAILFGVSLSSPWFAGAAPGSEIKLPPLRVQVGEKAPNFALPAASGKTVGLTDFSGHRILIDFYRGYW